MKAIYIFALAGALLAGTGQDGIRPRGQASDYPAHETSDGVTVAAAVVPADQVRKLFATDLNKGGYIVVEVGIYPDGKTADVSFRDFVLRAGSESTYLRASDPRTIASVLRQKNTPPPPRKSDVAIYPTATIGYESGPNYDPASGRSRSGGVYGGAGVGIATGGAASPPYPAPASTDRDEATMQQELHDKILPEGKVTQPVAGYLFFPRPSGKARNALYEMEWFRDNGKLRISIPPAAK